MGSPSLDLYAAPQRWRSPRAAVVFLPLTLGLLLLFWGLWQALLAARRALALTLARLVLSKWTVIYFVAGLIFTLLGSKAAWFFSTYSRAAHGEWWVGWQLLRFLNRYRDVRELFVAWAETYQHAAIAAAYQDFHGAQLLLLALGYVAFVILGFLVLFGRQFARRVSGFGAQGGSYR